MNTKVLAITSGTIHPKFHARRRLLSLLRDSGEYEVVHRGSIEALKSLRGGGYAAAVIYLHRRRISAAALEALRDFLRAGGGLLGIHSASASFKSCAEYYQLLGGRFVSHDAIMEFEVIPSPGSSSIFAGCGGFTVRDELYLHDVYRGTAVRFHALHGGREEPMVWTREEGKGRVCYIEPGHCASSIGNAGFRQVTLAALRWLCSGREGR
ncbi:MAG: ThuA domain-containing protein [Spirochaetes bacterium]|nr:ThuA domain-containing protein [Spirochaetota bacterium]